MSALLTVRQVLAAQSQLPQLSLEVANDLFRSTWLASHVRLVELMADTGVDLPPFLLKNPHPDPVPFFFDLIPVGLAGLHFQVLSGATNGALAVQDEWVLEPGQEQEFFVRVESTGAPGLVGDQNFLDVLPYANGQVLLMDGIPSGVRYLFEPWKRYLPIVVKAY